MTNGNPERWQHRAGEQWFFMEVDGMGNWDYNEKLRNRLLAEKEYEEELRLRDPSRYFFSDDILNIAQGRNQTIRPTYTSTVLAPPPAEYLVTYIGGPKNGFQEILERKAHPKIEDSKNYQFALQQEVAAKTFIKDQMPPPVVFSATYMMVFIPLNQTPFTDMQCICAVFVQ